MMNKEELLEKYFVDVLTPEEQTQFESFLKEDPEFSAQFEFEKSVKRVIKSKNRKKLQQRIKDLENEPQKSKKGKLIFFKPLRMAAAIAVIVSLGIYVFSQFKKEGVDQLYASNYEKYPNTVFPIKRSDEQDVSLEFKAFKAYEQDQDEEAIQFFKELQASQNPEYIGFYLGQSYLKANQTDNAITAFKQVIISNSKFTNESRWYLALAYLKNKDTQNAIKTLEEIIAKKSYKSTESKVLLEVID